MPRRDPRAPRLVDDVNLLLDALCEEWDFCAGLRAETLIQGSKPLTSKRFTDAVLDAEAELSGPRAGWERRIKRRFVQRYGHSITVRDYRMP